MSFLQPAMLIALPLIALPIVIHLINQRRFQTVQWGAMQFLLAANRMSRGYARIRQWLIDPSPRKVFAFCYLWKHWSHNADVKKFNDVFVRNAAISLNA